MSDQKEWAELILGRGGVLIVLLLLCFFGFQYFDEKISYLMADARVREDKKDLLFENAVKYIEKNTIVLQELKQEIRDNRQQCIGK